MTMLKLRKLKIAKSDLPKNVLFAQPHDFWCSASRLPQARKEQA